MNNLLNRFKNWKTTLIGVLASVLLTVGGKLAEGEVDYKIILSATASAVVGSILKDPKKVKEELPKDDTDDKVI